MFCEKYKALAPGSDQGGWPKNELPVLCLGPGAGSICPCYTHTPHLHTYTTYILTPHSPSHHTHTHLMHTATPTYHNTSPYPTDTSYACTHVHTHAHMTHILPTPNAHTHHTHCAHTPQSQYTHAHTLYIHTRCEHAHGWMEETRHLLPDTARKG